MLRLVCTVCRVCIVGRDTIEAHVAEHKSVGDAVQVWWAVSNGLVLRPVVAASYEKRFGTDRIISTATVSSKHHQEDGR
jgi:hypothetical protein